MLYVPIACSMPRSFGKQGEGDPTVKVKAPAKTRSSANIPSIPLREVVRNFLFERAAVDHEVLPVTEVEIAQRLRLSRTPARKALIELERDGLITRKKKKGIYLRRPELKELVEVYDVRSIFEGFAARIAAERIDTSHLDRLEAVLRSLEAKTASNDLPACVELDMEFHRIIIELADNSILKDLTVRLGVLERTFFIFHGDRNVPTAESPFPHKAILDALRSRQPDLAEQLVRQHIQWAKKKILESVLEIKLDRF